MSWVGLVFCHGEDDCALGRYGESWEDDCALGRSGESWGRRMCLRLVW